MTITNKVTNRSMMPGITPVSDVPDAPTIGTATAGDASASVTFTAAVTGGTPTLYRAISTPGSIQGTNTASPITVSGLTNGTAYTFTVRGENSTANGPYSSATTGITPISLSNYFSIQTATVDSGGASSITFNSIPSTYTHLQIRGINQTNRGTYNTSDLYMTFNGDGGNNYAWHQLFSNASANGTVNAGAVTSTSSIKGIASTGSPATTAFAGLIIDILDYTNTNKYKTVRMLTGADTNGLVSGYCGVIEFSSGLWQSTSAISSISFYPLYGTQMNQYTTFSLYGVK